MRSVNIATRHASRRLTHFHIVLSRFKPFSKYPPCYKDISFWTSDSFTENNFCELIRDIAGDLVEEVKLIDSFENKKLVRRIEEPQSCVAFRFDSISLCFLSLPHLPATDQPVLSDRIQSHGSQLDG